MITLTLCLLAAAPLETARDQLNNGQLDELLFTLDKQTFSEDEKPKAAALLSEAAQAAAKKNDDLLALQFAQMSLAIDPAERKALEVAARTSLKQQQFEAAERYADRWVLADVDNGSARLLRGELAVEAGEWDVAIDQLDQATKLKGAEAEKAKKLKAKASKELKDRKTALSTVAALEKQMAEAIVRSKSSNSGGGFTRSASTGVVIYTTTWCGYCKKTKEFLKKKGVSFVEKDIEKDSGAAQELAQKAAAAGVRASGVPVTDVRGKLIVGFDQAKLEAAL
jgi:glutaredoxin-like YruB-family protein